MKLSIVHAVAVFSELGIATAAVLLADIPRWRGLIKAAESDPIEIENLKVQAKKLGKVFYWVNCLLVKMPTSAVLYSLPFFAFTFGVLAMVGISHVPTRPFTTFDEFWRTTPDTLDVVYWYIALGSFAISMIAVVIERTSAKLATDANKTKGASLEELN